MKKFLDFVLFAFAVMLATAAPGGYGWMQVLCVAVVIVAMLVLPKRKAKWDMHLNGGVTVSIANGQLGGVLVTNDTICGFVMTGVTEGGGYTAGTPIYVTGLASIAAAGITVGNNAFALKEMTEFYTQAGDGTPSYWMLVPNTMTVAQMADNTNANGAKKLLNYAIANGLPIRYLGLNADDAAIHTAGGTITVTNGMNADVYTGASNMAVMAAAYQVLQAPFRCIIGGSSYNGTASALVNELSGTTNNRVAIFIGDTVSHDATYSSACIGLWLGRKTSVPVQRKGSRVLDGALTNTTAFLHSTAYASAGADPATIAGKGYITFTTYANVAGFFFSGEPMLTATTDDFAIWARGAVMDTAQVLAYATFIQQVDNEIPVDDAGNINPGFAKYLEQQIINQITLNMVANNKITAVDCYINPAQNILSTGILAVVLKIRPVGYATTINVTLGFEK